MSNSEKPDNARFIFPMSTPTEELMTKNIDKRRYFYINSDCDFRFMLHAATLRRIPGQKTTSRQYINSGDYVMCIGTTEHAITLVDAGCGGYHVYTDNVKQVYRYLKQVRKIIASRQEVKDVIKPILPKSLLTLIETEIFDFYRAIDDLGTTKGFGNVGMIFHGPAGVGKSETMRWLREVAATKFNRSCFQLGLAQLRKMLAEGQPFNTDQAMVVIDDIDANILRDREITENPLTSQFLTCLDGLDKHEGRVIVISTNEDIDDENGQPIIDPALTRPGRFEHMVEFKYPTADLIVEFCQEREIEIDQEKFKDWSFARIDMFCARYKVAKHRHGTKLGAFYEKFTYMMGTEDPTVEAYRRRAEDK